MRNIDTGGGDYAEGNINKHPGSFVNGDQFTMSGNFSGAILDIKSMLDNVAQSIGTAPHGDAATKAQLQALIVQLIAALQQAPTEHVNDAAAVAEISAEGLKQAAQNIAAVLPMTQQIAEVVRKLIGA